MLADWEVEIGGEAPIIDVAWEGFVDLRAHPDHVVRISEIENMPGLRNTLLKLNAQGSPVWTAKCDVWALDDVDIDELDATPEDAAYALACYIDLLPRAESWMSHENPAAVCRSWCASLAPMQVSCCRADFVVRSAIVAAGPMTIGITAYFSACGRTKAEAESALCKALESAVAVIAGG